MKTFFILLAVLASSSMLVTTLNTESNSNSKTITSVDQLSKNQSAETILLTNQGLKIIPGSLQDQKAVKKLVLSNNFLTTLPDFFTDLEKLKYLDLSGNPEIDLDQNLEQLKDIDLKTLHLSNCNLVYVPSKIGKLKGLHSLDLSENHLIDLPLYLGKLKKLTYLNLASNEITSLDYGVWKCKKLQFLDLSGNKGLDMKNICMNLQPLKNLQTVAVSHVNDTLPYEFGAVTTRQWMIDNSTLNYMPSTIANNTTLEEISFESCENTDFNKIAPVIGQIKNLQTLRISNSFDELPENIRLINQVHTLDLSNNKLTTLPISQEDFPNLSELVLYGNDFPLEEWMKIRAAFPNCNIMSNNIPEAKAVSTNKINNAETSILPPLTQIKLPVEEKAINSARENKIEFEGATIEIPKDAFVDKDGNKVNGNVIINYSQYNDPLDIFLSGIPMKYDSADVSTYFQSAGMFDISASANGEEVYLDEGKEIKVDMNSNSTDKDFSLYSLDKNSGQWNYESTPQETSVTINSTNIAYEVKPIRPKMNNKPLLSVEQIGIQIEKIRGYYYYKITTKNENNGYNLSIPGYLQEPRLLLPLDQKECRVDRNFYRKYYDHKKDHFGTKDAMDISFEVDTIRDCYLLTVVHADTVLEIPMKVSANAKLYEKEQKDNLTFWKKLGKSAKKVQKTNTKVIENYEEKLFEFEASLKDYEDQIRDWYANNPNKAGATRAIVMDYFTVWNCDRVPRMEEPKHMALAFKKPDGSSFSNENITLLDYSDNGCMTFSSRIVFDKGNKVAIVAFEGDQMIFINSNDFTRMVEQQGYKDLEVEVEPISATNMSIEELHAVIF